jgi:hypothetical protein
MITAQRTPPPPPSLLPQQETNTRSMLPSPSASTGVMAAVAGGSMIGREDVLHLPDGVVLRGGIADDETAKQLLALNVRTVYGHETAFRRLLIAIAPRDDGV